MRPEWVVNPIKYDRALLEFNKTKDDKGKTVPFTEAQVKARYVEMAGLLLEDAPENIQARENLPQVKAKKRKK